MMEVIIGNHIIQKQKLVTPKITTYAIMVIIVDDTKRIAFTCYVVYLKYTRAYAFALPIGRLFVTCITALHDGQLILNRPRSR